VNHPKLFPTTIPVAGVYQSKARQLHGDVSSEETFGQIRAAALKCFGQITNWCDRVFPALKCFGVRI
jgi:hypothetical protein